MISRFNRQSQVLSLSAFTGGIFLIYSSLAINMKPIADDYCAAARASLGFFESTYTLSSDWSGDYFQIIVNYFFIGLPGLIAPFYVLGITNLLISLILLVLFITALLRQTALTIPFLQSRTRTSALIGYLLLVWFFYWSAPASINIYGKYGAFLSAEESFSAVFGWPTVISQYLTVPLFIGLLIFSAMNWHFLRTSLFLFSGFLVGVSGYALALAVIASTFLFMLFQKTRFRILEFLSLQFGVFAGLLISFFSTGAQKRTSILIGSEMSLSFSSILRSSFVSAVEAGVSVVNLGVLITFTLTFFSTIIYLRISKSRQRLIFHSRWIMRSVIFLLLYFLSISASEVFTYEAFWHLITFKTLLFISVLVLAVITAGKIVDVPSSRFFRQKLLYPLTFLTSASAILLAMDPYQAIIDRGDLWLQGNAPLPGISDIDPSGSWVDLCWQELRELRNMEER